MEENKIKKSYEPFQGYLDRFLIIIDSNHHDICSLPLRQEEFDIIKTWDGFQFYDNNYYYKGHLIKVLK